MSGDNFVRAPDAEMVRAQAASWLLRCRDYDVWTEEDQCTLDRWLDELLAHRIAYLRLEAIWRDADRLTILRPRAERRVVATLRRFIPTLVRITASFVVAATLAYGAYFYISSPVERTYATGVGEHKIVTLTDGSRIELNTDTSLQIRSSTTDRYVTLVKGEAYFKITHNARAPFVVETGNYRIVDLGTEFVLRKDNGQLNIDLVEGSARFESSDADGSKQRSIVLTPGDAVVATADSLSLKRKPADQMADFPGWRRGMLVFHRTPLAEVVAEYNRYNAQKIEIVDQSIAQRTITATLPTNDIEAFARIADNFFGLHVTRRGNNIAVSR